MVIRRCAHEFTTNTPQDTPFSGVVTVDRSLEAKRMQAGQNINGAILIVTQFRLTQGQPGLDADVVTYRGRKYRMTFADPYIRAAIKKRKVFPTDDSVQKVIYLAIKDASKKWNMPIQSWRQAMSRFIIEFGDRLSDHL
ncbi:putative transposase [Yersinia pekkanenii]|uniref:Transposase n=1 Tax=Yersinia pekkanenii TaxID=1288385 RepID=A0A0T9RLZ2_9GAMM|nr:putative transposase [Yersinia pekkanenii]CRY64315.1 putative transposase [Yersinia pekkanenii]